MTKSCTSIIISCLLTVGVLNSHGQDIHSKIDSLRRDDFYEYWDSQNKKLYSHGWIEQIYPCPIFKRVIVDSHSKIVTIEGQTIEAVLTWDGKPFHLGICCFSILIAQANDKNELTNIRPFGYTNDKQLSDSTKPDGFFRIQSRIHPNDILIIGNPGRAGSGALVYRIDKLLKEE